MAVWRSAWVVVLMACAGVCARLGRQEWGGCGPVVCEEVVRQAEGLARLRLLRNYVSQAMELLDQTMDSIEDDVMRSGQSLSQFIGGQCSNAHTILHQIMQESDDDDHLGVNHGSHSHIHTSTSQSSTYHRPSTTTTHHSSLGGHTLGTDDHDDDWPDINRQTDGDSHTSFEQSSAEVNQDLQTSSSITSTSEYRLTNKFDHTTDSDNQDSREDYRYTTRGYTRGPLETTPSSSTTWRTGLGTGGSGFGFGGGRDDNHRGSHHGGHGSHHGGHGSHHGGHGSHHVGHGSPHAGHGSHHGGGASHHSGTEAGGGQGVGCRSLPGTPHWVPGLDVWCADNCPLGNCPQDRCVC